MLNPRLILAALDDDEVRAAVTDAIHRVTGTVAWLVDEEHKSTVRPCVAGQADVLCWQFMDGTHLHLCAVPRTPWKETHK